MAKEVNFEELDELDHTEGKSGKKDGRRNVTDKYKGKYDLTKRKNVTTISVPTQLLVAVDEYCEKMGISKASFFSQLAREKLKNEDLETEF